MSRETQTIEATDGIKLDARIFRPPPPTQEEKRESEKEEGSLAVVLVHPYSVLGGCQGLMKGIAHGLARRGFLAVTFDMRGVGAPIAGSAVDQLEEVVGYVSLGYPFGLTASILFGGHHKAILQSPKPKLFVMGTRDGFTSVKQLQNKLKSAAGRVETHLIEGVSHFQMEGPDYDAQMVDLIVRFIRSLSNSASLVALNQHADE